MTSALPSILYREVVGGATLPGEQQVPPLEPHRPPTPVHELPDDEPEDDPEPEEDDDDEFA